MPTLLKLLAMIAIVCALIFAGMVALVAFVQPEERTITVSVPLPKPAAKP
jgi:hypothetical protein